MEKYIDVLFSILMTVGVVLMLAITVYTIRILFYG